ncbi:uncharacterized protein BDZ99DRAFT_479471 [Mytilinidion resinicola]|uniref:Uncharacterized protein n=1 Tax=Mytilinidion resinicola TaxID=574789 RepID=A0A6A6YCF6_9PEZI|nr:uncharacterized protein BDZ99DRAFT_479471 [Mytilinidion resinicola]KAF2806193.1 hypothetical protein BDZ99DRAFT_479471 [Mytilinidion resinicola]
MGTSGLNDNASTSSSSSANTPMGQQTYQTTEISNTQTELDPPETKSAKPLQSESREANSVNPSTPVGSAKGVLVLDLKGIPIRRGGPHPSLQRTASGQLFQENRSDLTREWSSSSLDNLDLEAPFNYNIDDRVVHPPMSDEEFEALPEWDDSKNDGEADNEGGGMPLNGVERAPIDGGAER